MLLENENQGQTVSSQKVVATCRLPWHFKVGKRQDDQGAAAPADLTLPFRNGAGSPNEQDPVTGDSPIPRPCAGAELRVPTLKPMMPSLYMGGYQAVGLVPGSDTQALEARSLGAEGVAEPPERKRGRDEADLDAEDSQMPTGRRRVRPRSSTGGPSAPLTTHSRSRASTRARARRFQDDQFTTTGPYKRPSFTGNRL